ncbi:hypothetical protein FRB96_003371 [Tulasnella sp. 330]|nr:hypothetical protein FRB96_003371 [Tulasnella sp. 330]KAG8876253.1 hypothetical protein FRB97_004327 [Tulasnella sp. 331]KAG8887447.1 hypothetical protein FRB98_009591 [Tulasnella sp. 332]
MTGLISCTTWVARGVAQQNPKTYDLDEKELERVSALARMNLEDARAELAQATETAQKFKGGGSDNEDEEAEADEDGWVDEPNDDTKGDIDGDVPMEDGVGDVKQIHDDKESLADGLAEYKLDDYDDDESESGQKGRPVVFSASNSPAGLFSNVKGLTYHADNADDPYITLKDDEDDEEREELEVLPSDNLVVAAKTEDDVSSLEIYVYDDSQDNLYIHHDILLPSFPLCLEWLDYVPGSSTNSGKSGNYVAVGTFDPEIEIWSLDVLETIYPDALLGRPDNNKDPESPLVTTTKKKKKKKEKKAPPKPKTSYEHHIDAVLGLSWNRSHRNLLASASADKTVKLWDLSRELTAPAIRSFDVHEDKVQAVQWNKLEPTVLLTGSYDRTVRTFDSRSPGSGLGVRVSSDVEALRWDPWEGHACYVSLENGLILNFDARTLPSNLKSPCPARFTLQAHDGAASGLDVNTHVRGCIASGGTDGTVKVWNVNQNDAKLDVSMVASRDLGVGKVFSVMWSPDDPLTLAAAGSQARLQIWDVASNAAARKVFGDKLPQRSWKERSNGGLVGMVDDDDGDESDAD